jgi:hypothetical protein
MLLGFSLDHGGIEAQILSHLGQGRPFLTQPPQGFFFELFGVTVALCPDTPPGAEDCPL